MDEWGEPVNAGPRRQPKRSQTAVKIAYGTYAMPTVALEDAIPALADIGYDGVEICIG